MARKKAQKKSKEERQETLDEQPNEDVKIHEAGSIVTENEESTLPVKDLFRIDEVAEYFSVTERTIRLWIDHGHLVSEKVVGSIRVSRKSILECRFRNPDSVDIQ